MVTAMATPVCCRRPPSRRRSMPPRTSCRPGARSFPARSGTPFKKSSAPARPAESPPPVLMPTATATATATAGPAGRAGVGWHCRMRTIGHRDMLGMRRRHPTPALLAGPAIAIAIAAAIAVGVAVGVGTGQVVRILLGGVARMTS